VKSGNIELGDFPLLLAPMEDVSDPPFRAVCKENGADLMYTEFISAEGLIRDADKSVQKLDIYDYERPIGIQIFGEKIESMREAAAIAENADPEIIDINYGCPVKKVACKGAGAGILLDLPKMQAMTSEIVKRVNKPVTVKTRLGWDENSIKIEEVAMRLQDVGVQQYMVVLENRCIKVRPIGRSLQKLKKIPTSISPYLVMEILILLRRRSTIKIDMGLMAS
jgi:tRNA-dihydrouridine synthase B